MEKASKSANYAVILGDDELANNTVSIKNLSTSEQINISRDELLNNI